MATNTRELKIAAPADKVWTDLRDFGQVYNAALHVMADGPARSSVIWTIDLLPDELAPAVAGMMDHALPFMKKALEA